MAKMYPAIISSDIRSPGEPEVFRRLKDDPLTQDWIVLHSLNIAEHLRQVAGEVDFLIIVPSKGVLCLEVKAVQSMRRENGLWYYGAKPTPDARGPFRQAADAMHSLRKKLVAKDPTLSRIIFWSAALFPYIEFNVQSSEWHSWQAIDIRHYYNVSIGNIVLDVLDKAREYLRTNPAAGWFDPASHEPNPNQCKTILHLLRPDFELFEPPTIKAEKLETELKRFTEEQYEALDVMSENPRVFFTGPAGTGKTLLAMEAAKRGRADGRRILLLCFNRLLGVWLRGQMGSLAPEVTTSTLHRYMLDMASLEPPSSANASFWEYELPQRAMEHLLEDNTGCYTYDELVLDEVQDLLREQYVDFLDISVKGGLSSGRWRCFGDLERQAIFSPNPDARRLAETRFGNGARYALRVNCRNTPRITEYVHLLARLKPRYSRVRRPDNGIEPVTKRYSTFNSQRKLLAKTISELEMHGYRPRDIVILSPLSEEKCVATSLGLEWQERLAPLWGQPHVNRIRYGSIHAYKGLEAPVVVVTDIETVRTDQATDLFYIAITRALDRLVILVHESASQEMLELLAGLPGEHSQNA